MIPQKNVWTIIYLKFKVSRLFVPVSVLSTNIISRLFIKKNLMSRFLCRSVYNSGGSSGEATEAGPHPHLSMNLNKNLFLRISILQICFYIIIIL
jgi:hypothetical protein